MLVTTAVQPEIARVTQDDDGPVVLVLAEGVVPQSLVLALALVLAPVSASLPGRPQA